MRIGISSSTLDRGGYGRFKDKTYEKLKECGFSATDFGMANTETFIYTLPEDEADALLRKEKALAGNAGIEIFQVHGPWRFPPQDFTAEDRAERFDKMERSIRATSVLGVKNWVIHPLMPFGTSDIKTSDEKGTWDINVEFFGRLIKTAKECGVYVCLENMPFPDFSISTPESIMRLVESVNDENMRVCLDTGHVNVFGLDIAEEVKRVKDKIQVLHVHDNNYGMDLHRFPYFGTIDWKKFGAALKEIKFSGVFSLETNPPTSLSDDLFEKTGRLLCETAESIVK